MGFNIGLLIQKIDVFWFNGPSYSKACVFESVKYTVGLDFVKSRFTGK